MQESIVHKEGLIMKKSDECKEELMEGVDFVYVPCVDGRIKYDAKEYDPKYRDILDKAFHEADQNLKSWGLWHWDVARLQKKILKEKYGITWRHIYELNPEMVFD